jgi:hypothetical protein
MNKKIIFVVLIIGFLIILGSILFISPLNKSINNNGTISPTPAASAPNKTTVAVMNPEEIGLSLTKSNDGKKVILKIAQTNDIKNLSYNVTYVTENNITKGFYYKVDDVNKLGSIEKEVTIDMNAQNIKFSSLVTKTNGATGQIKQSL